MICTVAARPLWATILCSCLLIHEGFHIVAAFDADPRQVGQTVGGITVQSMDHLQESIKATDTRIAIVAVPAAHAQEVIDRLVECDVRAILNYAPIPALVPPPVKLRSHRNGDRHIALDRRLDDS